MIPTLLHPLGISVRKDLPLTLTAAQADLRVTLNATGYPNVSGLYYRPDMGGPWRPYTIGTPIPLDNIGDRVQFWNRADTLGSNTSNYVQFVMTGSIYASGNLMSMLNFGTVCKTGSFASLFSGCTALLSAPDLPASIIEGLGMVNAFRGCSNMTGTVDLQAQTFTGESSCLAAFYGCSHLTGAVIRATQLSTGCLAYAFYGCPALTSVEVNFTEWLSGATNSWLQGNTGDITNLFIKPSLLPEIRGNGYIPNGWTVVDK